MRKNNYIALYYYAKLFILDARTLQVLEESPWLIDEKINNTSSDAVNSEVFNDRAAVEPPRSVGRKGER